MKNIYVVEDIRYLHNRYMLSFNKEQFQVRTFVNGDSFIHAFDVCKPDIILLDYDLASEYTGLDVARDIRKRDKEIPLVVISGYITPNLIVEFTPLNIAKFLTKQFQTEELVKTVMDILSIQTKEPSNSNNSHG